MSELQITRELASALWAVAGMVVLYLLLRNFRWADWWDDMKRASRGDDPIHESYVDEEQG